MDKYVFPVCLAAFAIVNLASLAPPMRKARGGMKIMTAPGWILYLIISFGAIWGLGYTALTGSSIGRRNIFWLAGVFGIIAAVRMGWELGAIYRTCARSGEEIERTVMLQNEIERLRRAVENEEARRQEHEDALKKEIDGLSQKVDGSDPQPQKPDKPDEIDNAPDPALLLKESGSKIPVNQLKNGKPGSDT
ncbi:MAG: hypothetical protein ACYS8W_19480, partial [Planctomycetota bacterium]